MTEKLEDFAGKRLEEAFRLGLKRELREVEEIQGTEVNVAGRRFVSFASNDYLGLSRHPDVVTAGRQALEEYGAGAGASRLVIGNLKIHRELESELAAFKSRQSAVAFATGYLANIGAICSLVGEGDAIISDENNHSSIIDACRLSRAKILVYKHLDMDSLREKMTEARDYANKLVVTESLFSIDGDIAPVDQITAIAHESGAWCMVDEAHATGILGENGRGAEELFGCTGEADIMMGTLSKAVGAQGGFIAGASELASLLVNTSRSLIYSTGLAPSAAAAALESLKVMQREPQRRKKLFDNVNTVNQTVLEMGLRQTPSESPIIPLTIGNEDEAVKAHEKLLEKGLIVPVMRYPTVPRNEACLRVSVSSEHTPGHLDRLAEGLKETLRGS